jgi:hypothetical protein
MEVPTVERVLAVTLPEAFVMAALIFCVLELEGAPRTLISVQTKIPELAGDLINASMNPSV